MSLSERLVQLTIRAKDYLTRDVKPATDAMKELAQEGARLKASLADASAARSLARTLRDNKQATEGLQQAFNDAKATLEDLTREVGDNEQATAGQRIAIREARRTLEQAEQAYKRNQSAIKNTTSELKRLGVDTTDIINEEKRLTAEIAENKEALQQNRVALKEKAQEEAKAAKAAADHAASTGRVGAAMESAGKRILAFGAAYLSLNAAVSLVRGSINLFRDGLQAVLNVGEQFEKLDRRMTSIMGSLAEGEKATAWVREFADSTGQRVGAVADAFAMLKSYGLDPMDGSMQALTDKAEQLGGGLESLQGITAAIGQMWAKEKIQQEEVLQLVERGINVWPMLSKALGKTTPELQDLAAKGKLGRDAVKLLIDEIGKSAQGSAAASLDSLTGKWNVLLNSIEGFAAKVASSGAMEAVKQRLQGLIQTLDEMANDGSLDRFAQSLSAAFVDGVEWVESFAKKLGTVDFKKFANDASTALSDFRSKLDAVTRSAELISSPFRAIADVWVITTGTCIKQMLRLVAVTGEAGAFIAKILPDAFGGRAVEEALKKQAGHVRSWMDKLGAEIDSSAKDIKANWRSVAGSASESAEQSANAFIQAGQKVRDELAAQAQDMEHHIRNNLTGLDNALSAIFLSETAEHLNEVERAITKAGLAGVMTAKEMAEAQEALNAKRGFLGLSVDVKEATQSLESLRAEQALLSKQYFEGALSLEAWQQGHNELTKKIRELEQGTQSATVAIKDLQSAQDAISAAKTIGELEAVKKALFTAYQNKDLNLEQFQQLHNQAAKAIRDLGGAADGSAVALAGLDNALGSLEKIQQAISAARTDVDINNIRAALKKLYEDGAISAEQYNAELKRTNDQQAELKGAIEKTATAGKQAGEQLTRSQEMYNEALKDSILTSEELRRISGQRMEEERRASGEAMERNRKGKEVAERDMSAMENWFGGVMTRARAPLAAMSAAALALFDKLRGVNQAADALDTSNVENTARSLKQVTDSLGELQKASANPMMGSLGRWAVETQLASAATQKKFLEEKLALQRLTEQYASGAIGAREFNAQANRLRGTLTLLDEADLSQLDSSIASAQQRMQQLGESSRSIWESLQDELDKLEGREVDIEARRMASRKRELEAQLEAAKADGDATSIGNLQRALQTLAQIQTVTEQQAANAAAKKLSEERAQQAQSQPQKTTPAQVIRLESKGKAVDIALNDKADQTALLNILEDAGLRSL